MKMFCLALAFAICSASFVQAGQEPVEKKEPTVAADCDKCDKCDCKNRCCLLPRRTREVSCETSCECGVPVTTRTVTRTVRRGRLFGWRRCCNPCNTCCD